MTTTTDARIVNPLIESIPDELDREALFEALLPLLSLLGITTHDYYSTPGITITRDEITLSIPAHYPPLRLGQHGRMLKEAETRITVRLTPEEVDGFTYQRVAAEIREVTADSTRTRRICEVDGDTSAQPTNEIGSVSTVGGRKVRTVTSTETALVRSGWHNITGFGGCDFCHAEDMELVAAYGSWQACQFCYVEILPKCLP